MNIQWVTARCRKSQHYIWSSGVGKVTNILYSEACALYCIAWSTLNIPIQLWLTATTMAYYGFCLKWILYSGKFSHGANVRIFCVHVLHVKIKTKKIWTIQIFAWTLTSLHAVKIEYGIDIRDISMYVSNIYEYGQLELCQIFEQPTQRLLVSCTIKTEAKRLINLERDHHAML